MKSPEKGQDLTARLSKLVTGLARTSTLRGLLHPTIWSDKPAVPPHPFCTRHLRCHVWSTHTRLKEAKRSRGFFPKCLHMAGFLYKKKHCFSGCLRGSKVLITRFRSTAYLLPLSSIQKKKAAGRNAWSGQFVSYSAGISALYNTVSSFCINRADTPAES
jgi:hypothetical protein